MTCLIVSRLQVLVGARGDLDTVFDLRPDRDLRGLLIDADVDVVELLLEPVVLLDLEHREHVDDEVGVSDDRQHLLTAAFARRAAPSISPGTSSSWMFAPRWLSIPGLTSSVVNS